ncbi:MAG: hypothetical protein IPM16_13630 [Chloroflexi bacterium]|nr:hypothetical protein [Chloroflexota bacterium]
MNIRIRRRIRRTLVPLMLLAMMAVGIAQADPLPVPEAPGLGVIILPVVNLLSPPDGVTVDYSNVFTWSRVQTADSYVIKMKVVETGAKAKQVVSTDNCFEAGFCIKAMEDTPIFDHVDDGDTVEWKVIAKIDDIKVKSQTWTVVVDTVAAPTTLLPAHGALLLPVHSLSWNNDDDVNAQYKVVVKDADSGDTVFKLKRFSNQCEGPCSVNSGVYGPLPLAETFTWFVKAKGYNGDKAKSATQTLYTPAIGAELP